ncbi:MAG: hypothetical protein QOI56_161, partial [Actinomycetota bacterium]|nr:hypothetical protein [Actinomycetota bacterium]
AWVVDLGAGSLHVARRDSVVQFAAGDSLSPLAFPDLVVEVATILP